MDLVGLGQCSMDDLFTRSFTNSWVGRCQACIDVQSANDNEMRCTVLAVSWPQAVEHAVTERVHGKSCVADHFKSHS